MSNSYPRDGIFNLHLTTIKDSYIPAYISDADELPSASTSVSKVVQQNEIEASENLETAKRINSSAVQEIPES